MQLYRTGDLVSTLNRAVHTVLYENSVLHKGCAVQVPRPCIGYVDIKYLCMHPRRQQGGGRERHEANIGDFGGSPPKPPRRPLLPGAIRGAWSTSFFIDASQ